MARDRFGFLERHGFVKLSSGSLPLSPAALEPPRGLAQRSKSLAKTNKSPDPPRATKRYRPHDAGEATGAFK